MEHMSRFGGGEQGASGQGQPGMFGGYGGGYGMPSPGMMGMPGMPQMGGYNVSFSTMDQMKPVLIAALPVRVQPVCPTTSDDGGPVRIPTHHDDVASGRIASWRSAVARPACIARRYSWRTRRDAARRDEPQPEHAAVRQLLPRLAAAVPPVAGHAAVHAVGHARSGIARARRDGHGVARPAEYVRRTGVHGRWIGRGRKRGGREEQGAEYVLGWCRGWGQLGRTWRGETPAGELGAGLAHGLPGLTNVNEADMLL